MAGWDNNGPVGEDDPEAHGPWDSSFLDDDFIRSATVAEPSAEERLRRHERRLRVENLYQRLAENTTAPADPLAAGDGDELWLPSRRPPHIRRIAIALVAVLIIGALVRFTGALSTPSDASSTASIAGGPQDVLDFGDHRSTALPSPSSDEEASPIGSPPPLPTEEGPFTFLATQPDSGAPMAYDPCRAVHYVVNARTAPPDAQKMVTEAIAATSRATGLTFIADGSSDENPSMDRAAFQPDRYGDRWAPVLIAWTDPTEIPELQGDTAGLGGSNGLDLTSTTPGAPSGRLYVTGMVSLDGPQFADIASHGATETMLRAVVQHELGHVVGLGHVDDPHELMYPTTAATTDWGPGDRRGLVALGRGSCFPSL